METTDLTPNKIMRHLLPNGSRGSSGDISKYPRWPPDMFGIAAYIAQVSDCYTALLEPMKPLSGSVEGLVDIGEVWASDEGLSGDFETYVQTLWDILSNCHEPITTLNSIAPKSLSSSWVGATLELMIIADSASAGLGFFSFDHSPTWIQSVFYAWEIERLDRSMLMQQQDRKWHEDLLRRAYQDSQQNKQHDFRISATILVPPGLLQVLPKTRTPAVGCTLRSASHHLALLPPRSQVDVSWTHNPLSQISRREPFNILLIPFPYEITGKEFSGTPFDNVDARSGGFILTQNYLKRGNLPGKHGNDVEAFVLELVEEAKNQVSRVDMVLLPELALNDEIYDSLVKRFEIDKQVRLFVSGVLSKNTATGQAENVARTTFFPEQQMPLQMRQKKHHRWRLESSQITTYSIGDSLDPGMEWWESIDVNDRRMDFVVFREGACFTTLICEDLARVDPCQTAIRSIGPNLVFALLMDGPQIKGRWPERYAMGLSDDPGSSVLTVTAMGLLKRSNTHFDSNQNSVAMWRDSLSGSREVSLPSGHHAVLLNLTNNPVQEYTLDGRGDGEAAIVWSLTGKIPIKL